jgi:hypothetical protein
MFPLHGMQRHLLRFAYVRYALVVLAGVALLSCNKQGDKGSTTPPERKRGAVSGEPAYAESARHTIAIFNDYQQEVVGLLKAALTGGGTLAAIEVCKGVSTTLDERFEGLPGVKVRRVTEQVRNPTHAPDEFEQSVFSEWREQMKVGGYPSAIARETDDGLRVMQPIMLKLRLCLRCHGTKTDISKEVQKKLKLHYPDDKATGYKMGDLRGAFSAHWPAPK